MEREAANLSMLLEFHSLICTNVARTVWNPAKLYQWLNDNPRLATKRGEYEAKTRYDGWEDLALRNGYAAAQEFLTTQKFSDKLRDIPVVSQWVQLDQNDPDAYTVSFTLPVVPGLRKNAGDFVSVEDEIEIHFQPKPSTHHPVTKELMAGPPA